MDIDSHLPTEPHEVATEVALILAGGCFRYLKSRPTSISNDDSETTDLLPVVFSCILMPYIHLEIIT